jgi:hypothetical protein
MENQQKTTTRKKALYLVATLLSSVGLYKLLGVAKQSDVIACGKPEETMRVLTQDGRLVEIDKRFITSPKRKAEKEEVQTWVHKPSNK